MKNGISNVIAVFVFRIYAIKIVLEVFVLKVFFGMSFLP